MDATTQATAATSAPPTPLGSPTLAVGQVEATLGGSSSLRSEESIRDLVIVGGGMGGLAAAALAARAGLSVTLCESHTGFGGCAGYFDRHDCVFDAGATALMGMGADEPLGATLGWTGLSFETVETPYRVIMPDRVFTARAGRDDWSEVVAKAIPIRVQAQRWFWKLQGAVGQRLFQAANGVPRLPVAQPADLWHTLGLLGPLGLASAATWALTVDDVLRLLGLKSVQPFRTLVAMLLQDTTQTGPESAPFANASAALQAYRFGLRRPKGGMRALAEGLATRAGELGADVRAATKVDRVEARDDGTFLVVTRRRHRIAARHVAFNLPLDLAAALLGRSLQGRLARDERRGRAEWSAFTGYLVFPREAVEDRAPLFHHVLRDYDAPIHDGNNVLISLSAPGDLGYAPAHLRVATLSTHTDPKVWAETTDRAAYDQRKAEMVERMRDAFRRALPEASERLVHAEFSTPRSWARYTRRTLGAVGGPPVRRGNSNFFAVPQDALGRNLWLVGDSVFPGQGTMAVVLSAIRLIERLTGRSWSQLRATPHNLAPAVV
ncbi:FAD-dependent pyridine nucleotide-disulfide oxidoreductase [Isosphaera pallida ATCC 43644]|uniref:FAD-dependent pyridine nucleotide-disulfide oxidoreductase n=1 Tax=Isosphaera pallida (strain ATCC 43644 / DSM 9630 / IS1B) TaxID=575540 RepID=E8R116_ISOPI|nr:NAD(P)-binding protein [Isosphaera pallida]ADV63367.1 FAD-dependent pyridine nucleotide-disulfide oxidoreductase [Isosphaera pallida ATCC 43644]